MNSAEGTWPPRDPQGSMRESMPSVELSTAPVVVGDAGDALDMAEQSVIDSCINGDRRSMELLYRRFRRRVFSLVSRMVGPQEAEELTQDVFIRVFNGLKRFRRESSLSTWVYRVSMNVCLSYLAKQKRRGRLVEDYRRQQDATHQDTKTNPWLRRQLEEALCQLPHGYRAVLILHDVEGLKHEEIARILGCRVGTCKSQLHKARMRMRELLAPALDDANELNEAEVSP